ncbi:uncharacterized protein LOC102314066 [Haplochromis burtoni]|uniref:uncharacterized protein LOC102314066 n=1 Tax=Haplochromis burtoni TaxID=8153 RepID=UPI0003BD459C|nr:uncharacterized protein LOC102314066 [Haplochromis burtoni]
MSCSPSMRCFIFLVFVPLLAVCRARGQSDVKPVVGKVGGDVRMDIGATEVDRDAHIVWSYGPKDKVIISYDNGTYDTKPSEKFQLDANGSLMIRSLTANDSGLYNGQIISKNGSSQNFSLTVVDHNSERKSEQQEVNTRVTDTRTWTEPDPNTPTAPQVRNHGIPCGLFGLAALLCTVLVVKNREPITRKCRTVTQSWKIWKRKIPEEETRV